MLPRFKTNKETNKWLRDNAFARLIIYYKDFDDTGSVYIDESGNVLMAVYAIDINEGDVVLIESIKAGQPVVFENQMQSESLICKRIIYNRQRQLRQLQCQCDGLGLIIHVNRIGKLKTRRYEVVINFVLRKIYRQRQSVIQFINKQLKQIKR